MKVETTFGGEVSGWDKVFLDKREIQKLFNFLEKELKKSPVMLLALEHMNVDKIGWVALHYCGDVEMRKLQKQFRKLDRTTDVLSFPTLEIGGIENLLQSIPSGERSWGDLVVSLESVQRGARRGKRKNSAELQEVLIHGFLHLLGMDHVIANGTTLKEAREMKSLQKLLFKKYTSI